MNILFITTHNLATNPRMVKEMFLAKSMGYQLEVICFEFDNWSRTLNDSIKEKFDGVNIISIPAGRRPFVSWIGSVATEKTLRFISKFVPLCCSALSQAISRRNSILLDSLKKVKRPDLVIGHNPGSMWAVYQAAKIFDCKSGFDVEDYHPGEGDNKHQQKLVGKLMINLLPEMGYVSFAAPLIKDMVKKQLRIDGHRWFELLNWFPSSQFVKPNPMNHGPVKFIWFSQNVSYGRGLELVLPFIKNADEGTLELHIIGHPNTQFKAEWLNKNPNLRLHEPMNAGELHAFLAEFDVGLALEPAKDLNNELAISNKILAYLQAGLFVLATNTKAQELILRSLPSHGWCFDLKTKNYEAIMRKAVNDIDNIRNAKVERYRRVKVNCWEKESVRLLSYWADNP